MSPARRGVPAMQYDTDRRGVPSHPPESPRSRRSRVFREQATEAISTLHLATQFDYRVGWGRGHALIEALVRGLGCSGYPHGGRSESRA